MTDGDRRHEWEPGFQLPPFPSGMTASEAEFAADLSAVQADDALLDALGGSDPSVAEGLGDLELNALLLAWRRDIDSEPLADLMDTDTAVTIVTTSAREQQSDQRARRHRMLVPVAAAAAVLTIAFTGTSLVARDAQPGDTLWGLTKVLYTDHARSIEAATAARIDLERANVAIAGGRIEDARKALNDAQTALRQVASEDNLAQLTEQHRQLSEQLVSPSPTPITDPAKPASPSGQTSEHPAPPPALASPTTPTTSPATTTPPPVETSTTTPTTSSAPSGTGNDPGTPRYGPTEPTPSP